MSTRESFLEPAVLARVENYHLLARTVVEGFVAGLHRSLFHGFGSEFVQYRHYSRGDDLKYVDWKVYARLDRLQTKVFQEETNTNCYIVLDCSASMGYARNPATPTKLQYGKLIAACLAYLVNRQGDNVGFFAYADDLRCALRPSHRPGQVQHIFAQLEQQAASGACQHQRVLQFLGEHFRRRGLVVLISDLLDTDEALYRALRLFRCAHHDCVVFHVLDADETEFPFTGTVRFVDSEGGGDLVTAPAVVRERYLKAFAAYLDRTEHFARTHELDYHRLLTNQPLEVALTAFLHRREVFR